MTAAAPDPDELGFTGLIAAGRTPEEAWAEIRAGLQDPEVRAIIADLGTTEEGRAALAWSREQWAEHGMIAPWDLPPETTP